MKRALINIFLASLSIVICLFLIEISLRAAGYFYKTAHNNKALAGVEVNNGAFNILCLGDSYTYGLGASPEESYPAQLQKLAERENKNIKVYNGGRPGNNSSSLLKRMQDDINAYRPQIIIAMIGCNNYWNLDIEESSYFKREKIKFSKKIGAIFSNLKVYKLLKISQVNFNNKMVKNHKTIISNPGPVYINPKSIACSEIGRSLYLLRKYSLAAKALKKALDIDKNNLDAYLWLADMFSKTHNFSLAKKEIYKTFTLNKDFSENEISLIICRIEMLHVKYRHEAFVKLRKYAIKLKDRNLAEKINRTIDIFENTELNRVLRYDLEEMIRLARENNIKIILQTYPYHNSLNSVVREIGKRYNITVADNEMIFIDRLKYEDVKDFFVADGHCNGLGYKTIAENVYNELVTHNFLAYEVN